VTTVPDITRLLARTRGDTERGERRRATRAAGKSYRRRCKVVVAVAPENLYRLRFVIRIFPSARVTCKHPGFFRDLCHLFFPCALQR
jgi:hypothetical protein